MGRENVLGVGRKAFTWRSSRSVSALIPSFLPYRAARRRHAGPVILHLVQHQPNRPVTQLVRYFFAAPISPLSRGLPD
jgi:hypothetical protein